MAAVLDQTSGTTAPERDQPSQSKGSTSCERCKTRKLRCDRQWPSCHRCAKAQASCEYSSRRRPGFPAGQRQYLEDKIRHLEAEVRRMHDRSQTLQDGANEHQQRSISREAVGTLDPTAQVTLASSETENLLLPTFQKTQRVIEKAPPTDLLFSLTALFFRHIHPWLPFLDGERVLTDMGSAKNTPLLYLALFGISIPYSSDSRLDSRSRDSFWTYSKRHILLDVIEEPSLMSLEALTILTLDLSGMTNGPQVWGALAIAVKFSMHLKPIGNRVLRLSVENQTDSTLNMRQQLRRQRLFWAIYALDSYVSITTGLPSELSDLHIEAFAPTRYSTWGRSQPSKSPTSTNQHDPDSTYLEHEYLSATITFIFSYQLELLEISRKLHQIYLQRPAHHAETDVFPWLQQLFNCSVHLFEWFRTLPYCLRLRDEPQRRTRASSSPPSLLMLHAYFHALVLHLHGLASCSFEDWNPTSLAQQAQESQQACINSVESMVEIVAAIDKRGCDKLGWPLAWSIWVACRYLLARHRRDGTTDIKSFVALLDFLKMISKYWQIAAKYWQLLKQALTELESHNQSGQPFEASSTFLSLANFRIPTSDLEDQARPDPVNYAEQDENLDVDIEEIAFPFAFTLPVNDPMSESGLEISEVMSENWFTTSLYPSSRYPHVI